MLRNQWSVEYRLNGDNYWLAEMAEDMCILCWVYYTWHSTHPVGNISLVISPSNVPQQMFKPLPARATCDDTDNIRNHTALSAAQQHRNQDIIAQGE